MEKKKAGKKGPIKNPKDKPFVPGGKDKPGATHPAKQQMKPAKKKAKKKAK